MLQLQRVITSTLIASIPSLALACPNLAGTWNLTSSSAPEGSKPDQQFTIIQTTTPAGFQDYKLIEPSQNPQGTDMLADGVVHTKTQTTPAGTITGNTTTTCVGDSELTCDVQVSFSGQPTMGLNLAIALLNPSTLTVTNTQNGQTSTLTYTKP